MPLSAQDKAAVYADFVAILCKTAGETITITRPDLVAAVAAADAWADSNAASFNAAIPQPARSGLSAKQKARLLAAVLKRRYEVS